jgi:hypothetical protein
MLCLNHINQIKQALGISGVQTLACSWRGKDNTNGAQIDLIIDRKDDTINLCEIKYSKDEFEITKDYAEKLSNKVRTFINSTGTRKTILLTMITTYGIVPNAHSGIIQSEIQLDHLFHP